MSNLLQSKDYEFEREDVCHSIFETKGTQLPKQRPSIEIQQVHIGTNAYKGTLPILKSTCQR